MSSNADVATLLRAALARGADAGVDLLHAEYAGELVSYVRGLGAGDKAEDVAQETWIAVRRGLPEFRFESSPRTWIFSIAQRRFVDVLRSRTETTLDLEELELANVDADGWLHVPTTPESKLLRKERQGVIAAALAPLKAEELALLELTVRGFRPSEVIEILGLEDRPNTVSKRLSRLLKELRDALLKHEVFSTMRRQLR